MVAKLVNFAHLKSFELYSLLIAFLPLGKGYCKYQCLFLLQSFCIGITKGQLRHQRGVNQI